MKKEFKYLLIVTICMLLGSKSFAAKTWLNDLKSLYTSKQAIIYEVNIRTFNANDKDGNGIITKGEEAGNFVNAIKNLDELAQAGINTIKIMPFLPVSKTHAKGTAGSLYAPVAFDKINPQLKSGKNNTIDDLKRFVNECHKRKIRVIADLPGGAGYDLYSSNPNLFLKDQSGQPLNAENQDDVLLLNSGTEQSINKDVYKLYDNFVKLMLDVSVDGIAADMPETKTYTFWKKLIDETRRQDGEFLFLADMHNSTMPITTKEKLLEAGFDGCNGEYKNLNIEEIIEKAKKDFSLNQKQKKSSYFDYATYNTTSPTAKKGPDFTKQIIWLETTLPLNVYYIDGLTTGDNYMYELSNKKASYTLTDDKYYYMQRGQMDIYNLSRKPEGNDYDIYANYIAANRVRFTISDVITKGNLIKLKTSNPNIQAFSRSYNNTTVVTIMNTENSELEKVKIKVPHLSADQAAIPIKVSANIPLLQKGEFLTNLAPYEIQIFLFQGFEIK